MHATERMAIVISCVCHDRTTVISVPARMERAQSVYDLFIKDKGDTWLDDRFDWWNHGLYFCLNGQNGFIHFIINYSYNIWFWAFL